MALSKKHFEVIAAAVKVAANDARYGSIPGPAREAAEKAVKNVAIELAKVCEKENGSFDKARFFAACGVL